MSGSTLHGEAENEGQKGKAPERDGKQHSHRALAKSTRDANRFVEVRQAYIADWSSGIRSRSAETVYVTGYVVRLVLVATAQP